MVAMTSPVVRSVLSSSAAAAGGDVHGELTLSTFGEASSSAATSEPTARAAGEFAPARSVTVMSSC